MTEIAKKINPRNIPKTQADVDRAREQGIEDGVSCACAIMLTVLADKFDGAEYIPSIWNAVNKLSEEVKERRVSIADLRRVLLEEYGVNV